MCTGAEAALLLASSAAAYTAYDAGEQAKKRGQEALDRSNKAEAERKAAEDRATQNAYMQNTMARRALRANSLFTGGGAQGSGTGGRQTMGV